MLTGPIQRAVKHSKTSPQQCSQSVQHRSFAPPSALLQPLIERLEQLHHAALGWILHKAVAVKQLLVFFYRRH
jgi:hypothetical protein